MRKSLVVLLLFLSSFLAFALQPGRITEKIYYESKEGEKKQLESSIEYINGKKNGIAEIYSKNGFIIVKGSFRGDERHGLWTFYYENSTVLQAVEFYESGLLQGKQSYYYSNGKLQRLVAYRNNLLHGEQLYYYPNGKIQCISHFENGERIGSWKWYDINGRLEVEVKYSNSRRGTATIYDNDGSISSKGPVINGYKSGIWKFFDDSSKLLYTMKYEKGSLLSYEAYDVDGTVLISEVFFEGGGSIIEGKSNVEPSDIYKSDGKFPLGDLIEGERIQ